MSAAIRDEAQRQKRSFSFVLFGILRQWCAFVGAGRRVRVKSEEPDDKG